LDRELNYTIFLVFKDLRFDFNGWLKYLGNQETIWVELNHLQMAQNGQNGTFAYSRNPRQS